MTDTAPDGITPPADLTDPEGLAFFTGTLEAMADEGLAPDARELALITATAKQIQMCNTLAAGIAEHGLMSVGSQGQPVASPLLAAHTQAVNALNALLFKAKGLIPADQDDSKPRRITPRSVRLGA